MKPLKTAAITAALVATGVVAVNLPDDKTQPAIQLTELEQKIKEKEDFLDGKKIYEKIDELPTEKQRIELKAYMIKSKVKNDTFEYQGGTSDKYKAKKSKKAAIPTAYAQTTGTYSITIHDITVTQKGVDVLASASLDGQALGFGDGTVEIERFKVSNPPVLVTDPDGDIEIPKYDPVEDRSWVSHFTEDTEEALYRVIGNAVSKAGRPSNDIVAGKIGNTTYTYYPSDSETGTMDGCIGSRDTNYATMRSGSNLVANINNTILAQYIGVGLFFQSSGNRWQSDRCFVHFDTSNLTDTGVTYEATLDLWPENSVNDVNTGRDYITIVESTALASSLSVSDWGNTGAATNPTALADTPDIGSISTGAYHTWTFNATGNAYINPTGITKLAFRGGDEAEGTQPSFSHQQKNRIIVSASETAGTTQDPLLTVIETAEASDSTHRSLIIY